MSAPLRHTVRRKFVTDEPDRDPRGLVVRLEHRPMGAAVDSLLDEDEEPADVDVLPHRIRRRTFLTNHLASAASMDFFTVSTLTGRVLFVVVVLSHHRRRILHFNTTAHPTAEWAAQQVVEAFPDDTAPRWLHRDRDRIYRIAFRRRLAGMGIAEGLSAPARPWQNPYVERVIGSIRRDCLDHVIVLNESHLRRVLTSYLRYYHHSRTHLGLEKDTPDRRPIAETSVGTLSRRPKSAVFTTDTNDAPRSAHVVDPGCTSELHETRAFRCAFRRGVFLVDAQPRGGRVKKELRMCTIPDLFALDAVSRQPTIEIPSIARVITCCSSAQGGR